MTTFTLSARELDGLQRAARVLASPLEFPNVDAWRSTVNRELKALVGADSAGFLLPQDDGPLFYSDEHDTANLVRYPDFHPPSLADGTSIWTRLIACEVATMPVAYGTDVRQYTGSAYYNEYASPNGAHDTLCTMLPLGGADPRRVASVQLWRDRTSRRRFGERERQLVRFLFPTLSAGVVMFTAWHRRRAHLLEALDGLADAVLVCDRAGRVVHRTPAMARALGADPESALLMVELQRAAAAVQQVMMPGLRDAPAAPAARDVQTRHARYRIRAIAHGAATERDMLILVSLARTTPEPPCEAELRRAFSLTPAEVRVALHLADGRSNAEIAVSVGISPSTARRHTEHVLAKLGVRSRAAVGPRLLAHATTPAHEEPPPP